MESNIQTKKKFTNNNTKIINISSNQLDIRKKTEIYNIFN